MAYDGIHNILSKDQLHQRVTDGDTHTVRGTTYDHTYQYSSSKPHAPTRIGPRIYAYDLDGNQAGSIQDVNGRQRTIDWDEENRIRSVADEGRTTTFVVDDSGQRVLKFGMGETAYVNQHLTVRNRAIHTPPVRRTSSLHFSPDCRSASLSF